MSFSYLGRQDISRVDFWSFISTMCVTNIIVCSTYGGWLVFGASPLGARAPVMFWSSPVQSSKKLGSQSPVRSGSSTTISQSSFDFKPLLAPRPPRADLFLEHLSCVSSLWDHLLKISLSSFYISFLNIFDLVVQDILDLLFLQLHVLSFLCGCCFWSPCLEDLRF